MSLSVGERLKSAREAKKVSLEEACGITKIQKQTLEAIEQNRIQDNLDPVYARIFVKKYAVFLGLDGTAVVNEYGGFQTQIQTQAPPQAPSNKPASMQQETVRPAQLSFLVPAGVMLAALVGIGFLGYMAIDLYHTLREQRPPVESAPIREKKEEALELKQRVPLGKPLRLTVQTSGDVWLQMKADGNVIFQNVLAKGARETWTAKNDLEIWTGNAGFMQLFLNGKPLEGLGKGVRKGVKITRAGIQE